MRFPRLLVTCLCIATSACGKDQSPSACIDVKLDKASAKTGMIRIPAGVTQIGSDHFQPEERPKRKVFVSAFLIDAHEVTNAEFQQFINATGYRTVGEREGGGVFRQPISVAGLNDIRQWWVLDRSANWHFPHGRQGAGALPNEPVVQVTLEDALAYAHWRGRDLPTEEEWERAARGGLQDAEYTWGNEPDQKKANYWQGAFPTFDAGTDGFKGIAPVGCFPPNGYGLYDMAGNVWELTISKWANSKNPVIKGGSWLCADNYCLRYRPAARQAADYTLGTDHIGFRTVVRLGHK